MNLGKTAGTRLANFRFRDPLFKDVKLENTIITCAKSNWFSNGKREKPISPYWSKTSKMFGHPLKNSDGVWGTTGLNWIANTTRGTDNFSHCTHAIYLYNQYPNPQVDNFLDFGDASSEGRNFKMLMPLLKWCNGFFDARLEWEDMGECLMNRLV